MLVGVPRNDLFPFGSPHQRLARSGGMDERTVLGGMFSRGLDGTASFNEHSGHYGERWTRETQKQFDRFLGRHGIGFNYTKWND
jgi:hypothetical protein